MTEEELKDNMVSCYDNGDAMLEYASKYYADLLREELNKLPWISANKGDGWDKALETLTNEIDSIFSVIRIESCDK